MRKFPFGLATLGGLAALFLAGPMHAQTAPTDDTVDNDTAYTALRLMAKTLGKETLDHVAEVTGHDGKPQPSQWKITLREATGGSRVIDVAGGKVVSREPDSQPPAAKGLIHLPDLNLDSSGAFDATDAQARKVRLRFDSVNYVLRASESTGKPQWLLSLYSKEGSEVGAMRLAANDGNIVSIDGRLATGPATATTTPTPVVATSGRRNESTTTVTHTTEPVRAREPVATVTRTTESRTTTTTVGNPPPYTPMPAPLVATITDTETVEEAPTDRGEGGLFTRTGRTLDKTSRTVQTTAGRTLDKTSRTVQTTLRKTGSSLQRFFTGHAGSDEDDTQPLPPPPPRDPNYRGD